MSPLTPDDGPSLRSMFTDRLGRTGMRSAQILLTLTLVGVVVFGLIQIKLIVIPVLIAMILAAAAAPVVGWLRKHRVPAVFATVITLLAGGIVIGGIFTLIFLSVSSQWDQLSASATEGLNQLQKSLSDLSLPITEKQIEDARSSAVDFLTSSQLGSGVLAGVSAATQVITGIVLGVVILFFFLKDGRDIWSFFLRPFKAPGRARGDRIGKTALTVLGGYVRGTAIVAVVDSVAIGVGLAILQIPLALPLAVLVFLGAFIPLIGATLAGVLAVLVALVTNGPVTALIVVAIVIAVNQLEGNLLQPVVMGQSLKLHPLTILAALTVGTILGGIIGAVLAVPIAAVGWAIIKVWDVDEQTDSDAEEGEGADVEDQESADVEDQESADVDS